MVGTASHNDRLWRQKTQPITLYVSPGRSRPYRLPPRFRGSNTDSFNFSGQFLLRDPKNSAFPLSGAFHSITPASTCPNSRDSS